MRNVVLTLVGIVAFVGGIIANAYYAKRSEERIIAALKAELESLQTARFTTEGQKRIIEIEAIINQLNK